MHLLSINNYYLRCSAILYDIIVNQPMSLKPLFHIPFPKLFRQMAAATELISNNQMHSLCLNSLIHVAVGSAVLRYIVAHCTTLRYKVPLKDKVM